MPCTPLPGGGFACTRGRRVPCSVPGCPRTGDRLCDWKLGPGAKRATCDARLCAEHATRIAHNRDLCTPHATLHAAKAAAGNVVAATAVALLGPHAAHLAHEAEARKVAIEQRRRMAEAIGLSGADFDRILAECRDEAERSVYLIDLVGVLDRRLSEWRR